MHYDKTKTSYLEIEAISVKNGIGKDQLGSQDVNLIYSFCNVNVQNSATDYFGNMHKLVAKHCLGDTDWLENNSHLVKVCQSFVCVIDPLLATLLAKLP